jgi:uncharacterized membrane protein
MKKVLAVINAYIHDFASALWLATVLVVYWTHSYRIPAGTEAFFSSFKKDFFIMGVVSLAVIMITGIGRTYTYKKGEFGAESEKKRKEILIVKHILGFIIYGAGTYWQYTMVYA